jgi:uncharacterized protein YkwD
VVSATAAFGAAGLPATALAGDNACDKWGNSAPDELSNGEARKAIFCLINEKRDSAGLKPFDRSKKLQKAAQRHTDRMVGTGCFAHQCRGEAGLDSRLSSVDYLVNGLTSWAYGENIAWGMYDRGTPRAIVGAWMNSSGHRANILSRSFREIGVGFGAGTPQSKKDPGGIYTTDFGLAVG